jgi:hypothetical protein
MLTRREKLLIRPWQERRFNHHRRKVGFLFSYIKTLSPAEIMLCHIRYGCTVNNEQGGMWTWLFYFKVISHIHLEGLRKPHTSWIKWNILPDILSDKLPSLVKGKSLLLQTFSWSSYEPANLSSALHYHQTWEDINTDLRETGHEMYSTELE